MLRTCVKSCLRAAYVSTPRHQRLLKLSGAHQLHTSPCRQQVSPSSKVSAAESEHPVPHEAAPTNTQLGDRDPKYARRSVYMDAQATTPIDPRVLSAMQPYLTEVFGNAGSRTHHYGWEAENGVEIARKQVADLIGANEKEIIFTSGATESNNIAIHGVATFYEKSKKHIITTQIEHKAVLDVCRHLEYRGWQVTYLPVSKNGVLDPAQVEEAIRPDTVLVTVQTVNNEIGTVHPIAEIGKICRAKKVFFHTDAAQACGKMPIDVNRDNIDLMAISGHKMYGPKGVGCLYVRRKPRVRLTAPFQGGDQERGMRPGTVSAFLAVGMGEAARLCAQQMDEDHHRIQHLSNKLYSSLTSRLGHVVRNGDPVNGYPACVNLSFSCVEGESLLMSLSDIALSSGSACTSASLEPSYVLRAIGSDVDLAHSSLRFGLSRFTTEEEVDYVIERVVKEVTRLREASPLWEMMKEGIDMKTIKWDQH